MSILFKLRKGNVSVQVEAIKNYQHLFIRAEKSGDSSLFNVFLAISISASFQKDHIHISSNFHNDRPQTSSRCIGIVQELYRSCSETSQNTAWAGLRVRCQLVQALRGSVHSSIERERGIMSLVYWFSSIVFRSLNDV